ncbi:MAG: sulfotransferase [Rhodobacteraceae bacterium]|nr:sulfotransferase [Paracoccaceae bacterium]
MIDFLIIGAQKAATSALLETLRHHPDVYMPAGESAFFEAPDYARRPWEDFATDREVRLRGIKRPDYLCSDEAIARISAALPEARFIVVLREPVSRAVSSYVYMVRHAHLPALPLNPGLEACLAAHERGDTGSRAEQVIRFGLYGQYLQRWQQVYGRDRFLVMSQDLVAQQPARALELCAVHLDLDPARMPATDAETGMVRSNVGLYDPNMLKIARIGSLLKTARIPGTLRRAPRALPLRLVGGAITRGAEELARRRGQKRETLDPALRAQLQKIYDEDRALLARCVPPEVITWG